MMMLLLLLLPQLTPTPLLLVTTRWRLAEPLRRSDRLRRLGAQGMLLRQRHGWRKKQGHSAASSKNGHLREAPEMHANAVVLVLEAGCG